MWRAEGIQLSENSAFKVQVLREGLNDQIGTVHRFLNRCFHCHTPEHRILWLSLGKIPGYPFPVPRLRACNGFGRSVHNPGGITMFCAQVRDVGAHRTGADDGNDFHRGGKWLKQAHH